MKIAILGQSALAQKLARELLNLDAQVRLFSDQDLENIDLITIFKKVQILRVQKRHLSTHQEIPGRSRFLDLFRVIYAPPLEVAEDLYQHFDASVVDSLRIPIEVYEDFDVVVESREEQTTPMLLGPAGGPALGELNLQKSSQLHYLEKSLSMNLEGVNTLMIVGDHIKALEQIIKLKDWPKIGNHQLIIVTREKEPFATIDENLKKNFEEILGEFADQFQKSLQSYEEELLQWNSLEDYIRAKARAPLQPVPRIRVVTMANVLSVDQMFGDEKLYVTLEPIDFVENKAAPMTFKVDQLWVGKGKKIVEQNYPSIHLGGNECLHPEPGFYGLFHESHISQIKENLLSLFSKA